MKTLVNPSERQDHPQRVEDIELGLLLDCIHRKCGYDFRDYARASILRRVRKSMRDNELQTISALQDLILHDDAEMATFIDALSVNVTSMFRDAEFFRAFRKYAIPRLETYPYLRLWLAGCATGEEAYSVAIMLHEEGLLERSRIYATDFSSRNVQSAKTGVFPAKLVKSYNKNYLRAGGKGKFSDYYSARYNQAKVKRFILDKISFAQHNLVTDQSFNEFHVILCRNVMIYFNRQLQEHVMNLIHESIAPLGFMGLGTKEAIFPVNFRTYYTEHGHGTRLFQLKN